MTVSHDDFPLLRALFEQYVIVDCWCGESMNGVVSTFLSLPSNPALEDELWSEAEIRDERCGNLAALQASVAMHPDARKAGLIRELETLLGADSTDARRAQVIASMDLGGVLSFQNFWLGEGTIGDDPPQKALLRVLLEAARAFETPAHLAGEKYAAYVKAQEDEMRRQAAASR